MDETADDTGSTRSRRTPRPPTSLAPHLVHQSPLDGSPRPRLRPRRPPLTRRHPGSSTHRDLRPPLHHQRRLLGGSARSRARGGTALADQRL